MKYKTLENYPDVLTPNDVIKILNIGRNKMYELLILCNIASFICFVQ